MQTHPFTDEELLAYAEERLVAERATDVERHLRSEPALGERLAWLLQMSTQTEATLGALWRRGRWSCPSRSIWAAYVQGRLGDGLSQYLEFHLRTIGCRLCEASLRDLQTGDSHRVGRARRIFESSAGSLRPATDPESFGA